MGLHLPTMHDQEKPRRQIRFFEICPTDMGTYFKSLFSYLEFIVYSLPHCYYPNFKYAGKNIIDNK